MGHCDHDGLYSQIGCRKHVRNHHDRFYYVDKKPEIKDLPSKIEAVVEKNVQPPRGTGSQQYGRWGGGGGGGSSKSQTDQIVYRIRKFLCVSSEDLIHNDFKRLWLFRWVHRNCRPFYGDNGTEWKLRNSGQVN